MPRTPKTTNTHGQTTTDTGHVLTATEKYAAEIRALFEKHTMSENGGAVDPELTLFDTDMLIKDLATYTLDKLNDEYYRALKLGIEIGRKDLKALGKVANRGKK